MLPAASKVVVSSWIGGREFCVATSPVGGVMVSSLRLVNNLCVSRCVSRREGAGGRGRVGRREGAGGLSRREGGLMRGVMVVLLIGSVKRGLSGLVGCPRQGAGVLESMGLVNTREGDRDGAGRLLGLVNREGAGCLPGKDGLGVALDVGYLFSLGVGLGSKGSLVNAREGAGDLLFIGLREGAGTLGAGGLSRLCIREGAGDLLFIGLRAGAGAGGLREGAGTLGAGGMWRLGTREGELGVTIQPGNLEGAGRLSCVCRDGDGDGGARNPMVVSSLIRGRQSRVVVVKNPNGSPKGAGGLRAGELEGEGDLSGVMSNAGELEGEGDLSSVMSNAGGTVRSMLPGDWMSRSTRCSLSATFLVEHSMPLGAVCQYRIPTNCIWNRLVHE